MFMDEVGKADSFMMMYTLFGDIARRDDPRCGMLYPRLAIFLLQILIQ
jgi:hypothetical protein